MSEKSFATEELDVYIKKRREILGLDKRRKPASITTATNPMDAFTIGYEKETYTPRPVVTGDLLLTKFLS